MSAWTFNDGGRKATGFRGRPGDCVTRSIAIAAGRDYREVYDELGDLIVEMSGTSRARWATAYSVRGRTPTARDGVPMPVVHRYLAERGWTWTPTMSIGSGTTVHLRPNELPGGILIARVTRHVCAVIDGVIHDTHDPSRDGTRAVYGWWQHAT